VVVQVLAEEIEFIVVQEYNQVMKQIRLFLKECQDLYQEIDHRYLIGMIVKSMIV
jgi:hypothetical protein